MGRADLSYSISVLRVNNPSQENYSFVGAMKPLSKLVVIVIMCVFSVFIFCCLYSLMCCRVRGRHRGLPVAVDRAVMLPEELMKRNEQIATDSEALQHTSNGHLEEVIEEDV